GELRARAIDRHLIVARVDLDEQRAGLDELVVVHGDAFDGAAHARRDLRHVPIDLRIVGRLAPAGPDVPADAGRDEEEQRQQREADAGLVDEGAGHQRPPMYWRAASSEMPIARTRLPVARFEVKSADRY